MWQTIETAPRDGQYLLLWTPKGIEGHPSLGYWGRENRHNPIGWVTLSHDGYPINRIDQPEYWMPLPLPPERLQGEG